MCYLFGTEQAVRRTKCSFCLLPHSGGEGTMSFGVGKCDRDTMYTGNWDWNHLQFRIPPDGFCVCHFTASICSLFRSSSVSWPLATQQFTRPRRSSVCDMRGLPGQLFQQSDNERNPKKPIGCLTARLCRASIAMASIRWEYSDIYTHVDTSWTSLCSASWRRLSTWHCPHLLLNAVLQPVLRRRCRAPAAVDRCLLPTGAQQQTRHTPQRLSIDGTDGRPTVTWTLLCMLWGQVNNLLSVLSPNYCRGRATGIGSPCGPTPLFDRTS